MRRKEIRKEGLYEGIYERKKEGRKLYVREGRKEYMNV